MIKEIIKALGLYGGLWSNNQDMWELSVVIAERKVFLSTKKLTYSAKFKVDESQKIVKFSELLTESSSGLIDAGISFKTETYNTFDGARKGTIQEDSLLFGKKYQYKFDYQDIRLKVENLVTTAGYKFEYQIFPVK